MESPMSHDSSNMIVEIVGEHNLLKSIFFQGSWTAWAGQLGLAIHVILPTSDGHNIFVRTLFRVFLDSMEVPLSQDFFHMFVEDSG